MRVLVVTNMFLSGNGNWVAEQVRSLQAEGLEVDVVFFNTRLSRLRYGTSLPHIIQTVRDGKYDIIHTHHTYTMMQLELVEMLGRSHTPIVLTNHESEILDPKKKTRTWHPTSHLRHWIGLKRLAARRADYVIFVARQLAEALEFAGGYDVIPCGVDLEKFRPLDRLECRRRLGVPEDAVVVFFPADPRNARKRFPLARQAFDIVQRGVARAFMLTGGGIPADEMPFYYNAADAVMQTSFCEASPTVVKEALGCEVPVVSTDAGDTRDILRGVPLCSVCEEDPADLALRILEIGHRRVEGARQHLISLELDLQSVARRVAAVYEQVLAH